MIEKIREYISDCPYLDEFVSINVNYLVDKVKAYSVNEASSYKPVINTYLNGDKEMQFLFNFDAKFYWNEELMNNINNSLFFENFRNWLEEKNENKIFPKIEGIDPIAISAETNGYIYATKADEAIYRISCKFIYIKRRNK